MTEKALAVKIQERLVEQSLQTMLAAWPGTVPGKDRFEAIAMSIALKDPTLADCTPMSRMVALNECCRLGLVPNPIQGHIYLLPFNNTRSGAREVQIIIGYKGYIELARRSGLITTISANVICKNDYIDVNLGSSPSLTHRPWWFVGANEPGEAVAAYCIAKLKGEDVPHIEVMPKAEILGIKARSASAKKRFSPWVTDELMMWRKTVIRRAQRYLPSSPELADAQTLDIRADNDEPQFDVPDSPATDKAFGFPRKDVVDVEAEETVPARAEAAAAGAADEGPVQPG